MCRLTLKENTSIGQMTDLPRLMKMVGESVDQIVIDFHVDLRFSNQSLISFGGAFEVIERADTRSVVRPGEDKASLLPVLTLHRLVVTDVRLDDQSLEIAFDSGSVLRCEPNPDFEAWQYAGPENPATMMISMPGGEVAVWRGGSGTDAG